MCIHVIRYPFPEYCPIAAKSLAINEDSRDFLVKLQDYRSNKNPKDLEQQIADLQVLNDGIIRITEKNMSTSACQLDPSLKCSDANIDAFLQKALVIGAQAESNFEYNRQHPEAPLKRTNPSSIQDVVCMHVQLQAILKDCLAAANSTAESTA